MFEVEKNNETSFLREYLKQHQINQKDQYERYDNCSDKTWSKVNFDCKEYELILKNKSAPA